MDCAFSNRFSWVSTSGEITGRVVGVLNWLDVGAAAPRRVRHELDSVRDAGVSNRLSGFVTPALLHEYYGFPETTAGSPDVQF